ncbi:class I SAM-dependent DNA methyltransferase [Methanosarcina sp. T3]|uniref:class I SAM-dependent DNA methyltransferase n=1 Tax=Methanosarcina sp. T3 TaxID=3439062 RepID=UPI003F865CA6
MEPTIVEAHDRSAVVYDRMSVMVEYHGHEVLFGLAYEYLSPGSNVLDIGIGTGLSSYLFHKAGLRVYGVDRSEKMLDICRKKGFATELRLFDLIAEGWPYEDSKFDNAIACGIFHFFEKLDIFFKEIGRVMKKDGIFSFTVMVSEEDLSHYTDAGSGLSIYFHNDSRVIELLNKYGFSLLKCITFFIYKEPDKKERLMFKGYLTKKV